MSSLPLVLKLPRRSLARRDAVRVLVGRLHLRAALRPEIISVFAFKDEELAFARALAERTNLSLYRVNQRAFAGDFVVVDVSCPTPALRPPRCSAPTVRSLRLRRAASSDRPASRCT